MRGSWLLSLAAVLFLGDAAFADEAKKKLLLITDSGPFIHDSLGLAEDVLKEIGPKYGIETTCYRFTRDPDKKVKVKKKVDGKDVEIEMTELAKYSAEFRAKTGKTVEKENCGRVNAETLKKFDVVLFFTTGNPLTEQECKELIDWVKAGGAFTATHCGSDTLYPERAGKWASAYGDLVGGYFLNHPWHQKVKLKVEDPKHPGATGFKDGDEITDEIYQFREDNVYSRDRLHVILSVNNSSIDVSKGARKDKDYAISWCQEYGKGRSFFTSLGHRKEVWKDPRFQEHLMGGIHWALKLKEGDATPSSKLK
jgi:type 1 glutamine amidotransferase